MASSSEQNSAMQKLYHTASRLPVRLSSQATVVAKREHHYSHHNGGGGITYYATFEFESGDRMELAMSGSEYGLLVEGDRGQLTFQGSRYLSFDRMAPTMEGTY